MSVPVLAPNRRAIDNEISALRELAPKARKMILRGTITRTAAMQAQILVLSQLMGYDEIEGMWGAGPLRDAAIGARKWLNGEGPMPSRIWVTTAVQG